MYHAVRMVISAFSACVLVSIEPAIAESDETSREVRLSQSGGSPSRVPLRFFGRVMEDEGNEPAKSEAMLSDERGSLDPATLNVTELQDAGGTKRRVYRPLVSRSGGSAMVNPIRRE